MPGAVVDSSVTAALVFAEDNREEVVELLKGRQLLAPSLIVFELVSIASKKCALGLLTPSQALTSFEEFREFDVGLHDVYMPACLRVSLDHRLSAYDASYLHLSRAFGLELLTFDRRLARAASDA